mgnify:CR=1 FL=1
MKFDVRLYHSHDSDLIMLSSYGLHFSQLLRLALYNYARGNRIKYRLPGSKEYNTKKACQLRFRVCISDPESIEVLNRVKDSYRSQFCRQLVRDMLDVIPLGVYFKDEDSIMQETTRMELPAEVYEQTIGELSPEQSVTEEKDRYKPQIPVTSGSIKPGSERKNIERDMEAKPAVNLKSESELKAETEKPVVSVSDHSNNPETDKTITTDERSGTDKKEKSKTNRMTEQEASASESEEESESFGELFEEESEWETGLNSKQRKELFDFFSSAKGD